VKVIISQLGNFWRVVTTDRSSGTVERLFVPAKIVQFLLNYLRKNRDAD